MAFLRMIKGGVAGALLELQGERIVIGRHPSCQVVLDNAAVSRHHAQILVNHGRHYIEDLRSRNGTQVNGTTIDGRTELRDGDEVSMCESTLQFLLKPVKANLATQTMPVTDHSNDAMEVERPPRPGDRQNSGGSANKPGVETASPAPVARRPQQLAPGGPVRHSDSRDESSIISTIEASSVSSLRLGVRPELKLKAILEISAALGGALTVDEVLPKILQSLFQVFPQADAGFVLIRDPATEKLLVRATRSRYLDEEEAPVSMTIVRQAMSERTAILSGDVSSDERFDTSESLSQMTIRSVMCVPLLSTGREPLGVIQLSTRDLGLQFNHNDLDLLAAVCLQASLSLENAALHEKQLKQRDLERDLSIASQVQLGFLPSKPPEAAGYRFADYYDAAQRVGGDYFDYIALPDGKFAIAIGDVAGKGISAALLMARLNASVRYHLVSTSSAARAVTMLNAEIATTGLGFRFITFALIILDPEKHKVSIVNAGHLPPILVRAGQACRNIGQDRSGMPLGAVPEQEFEVTRLALEPGDTLFLYTDGVSEAMNTQHELFGRKRLESTLANAPHTCQEMVSTVVCAVESFYGDRVQRDDLCIVAFQRTGDATTESLPNGQLT